MNDFCVDFLKHLGSEVLPGAFREQIQVGTEDSYQERVFLVLLQNGPILYDPLELLRRFARKEGLLIHFEGGMLIEKVQDQEDEVLDLVGDDEFFIASLPGEVLHQAREGVDVEVNLDHSFLLQSSQKGKVVLSIG